MEFTRKQAERFREVMEACRRVQEERQRQVEWEAMERARREQERIERERQEQERIERERLEQERLERKRREREAAQLDPETLLRLYEENRAKLRSDSVGAGPLTLNDVPWP